MRIIIIIYMTILLCGCTLDKAKTFFETTDNIETESTKNESTKTENIVNPPVRVSYSEPKIGVVSRADLGKSLINVGSAKMGEGIEVYKCNSVYGHFNKLAFISHYNNNDRCYAPFKDKDRYHAFCVPEDSYRSGDTVKYPYYQTFVLTSYSNVFFSTLKDCQYIVDKEMVIENEKNFKQEFMYGGKSSSTIKFQYREYLGNIIRPAFTQEVQYDLKEGNLISFRELKIKILKATNNYIEYEIISNFKLKN